MREFVRRFRHGRSSVQLPVEAVVETSEQAPGDTEQSALPDSVDDAAWTEVLDFGDVEGAYLAAVHSATAPGRGRTRGRKLRRIRILGLLDAGTWAWIGTDDTWGVLSVDSEPCGQWDVQAGDTITAMVESQPWQHQLESVAPPTLQRVQHATAAADPEPVAARIGQASPAAAHAVGWKAKLKPGDVVQADIPYSPHDPVDRNGNLSKLRRAIFIKWGSDHAVVRGVYTASKKRYVNRNGGIVLRNANQVFDKPRVAVYSRNVEIDPGELRKKIGELDETDRGRVGIGGHGWVAGIPPASVLAEPSRTATRQSTRSWEAASASGALDHPLPQDQLKYVSETLEHWRDHPPVDWSTVFSDILTDISEGAVLKHTLDTTGVALTVFGSIVHALSVEYPDLGPKPHPLRAAIEEGIEAHGNSLDLCITSDRGVHMISRAGGPKPIPRDGNAIAWRGVVETQDIVPAEEISAIIYDQTWVYGQLQGRYRLDLNRISQHIAGSRQVASYVIGPNYSGVAYFHRAAEHLGWTVIPTNTRAEEIAAAVRLAQHLPSGVFALVSNAADLVPEVEDTGRAVVLFSDLGPYITPANH